MSVETADLLQLLEIAKAAAYEAGNYLLQKLGTAKVEQQKSIRDDLLDADVEAERIILTMLHKETPELGILSEESGHEGSQDNYWLVDPLDGSANFQHGSPLFAVSIALIMHKNTSLGVIYIPTRNECFTAIQGQGTYLNDKRIFTSSITKLNEAIVHVGDFTKENDTEIIYERVKELSKLALHSRRIRMIGTAATDLAYIACGRADVLINHANHPWDIEAGKLLLLEAGGSFSEKPYPNDIPLSIYSNGSLHSSVENLLF